MKTYYVYIFCSLVFAALAAVRPLCLSWGADTAVLLSHERNLNTNNLRGRWDIKQFKNISGESGDVTDVFGEFKRVLEFSIDDKLKVEIAGVTCLEYAITYRTEKTPVWIDLTLTFPPAEGKQKAKVAKGLIKLNGRDVLIHAGDDTRPADFKLRKGLDSFLIEAIRR